MISAGRWRFEPVVEGGFGDRHNTWAWSLAWWRGRLYATTNRAFHCAEQAGMHHHFPFLVRYPPRDPDVECAPEFSDMPLQAEIWRWTAEADLWERIYQSPRDVPHPDRPGAFLPRAIGFRGMAVFIEPDGTEALYVSGVNTRFIYRPVPPPQILRSIDGETFAPVPQDPGTFLGDLDVCSFRTPVVFRDRLYVQAGNVRGDGVLLEAADPAAGNDAFRQVSPPGVQVFDMAVFHGHLYLGLRYTDRGYAVVKTDARGEPPYRFTTVIEGGAGHPQPSMSVISMAVFRDRLYVGTDRPAEIVRLRPDDRWDLVVGQPRGAPDGWKAPLSTLDSGFSNWLNGHIWRMHAAGGRLFVGTWDLSMFFRASATAAPVVAPHHGFDLFVTDDGWHFTPLTTTGFDQPFNEGLRSFADTPHGLFLGTVNGWKGLQIWRATEEAAAPGGPRALEATIHEGRLVLSWEPVPEAAAYRIYAAPVHDERRRIQTSGFIRRLLRVARLLLRFKPNLYIPRVPDELWVPGPFRPLGEAMEWYYLTEAPAEGKRWLYRVEAVDGAGRPLGSSNLVATAPGGPALTAAGIRERLARELPSLPPDLARELDACFAALASGDPRQAMARLDALLDRLDAGAWALAEGEGAELGVLAGKLARRLALWREALLPAGAL